MTTAIDTNVVIALWDKDSALSLAAQNALDAAFHRGTLVAAAPVFAELIAAPGRNEAFVGSFFEETGARPLSSRLPVGTTRCTICQQRPCPSSAGNVEVIAAREF